MTAGFVNQNIKETGSPVITNLDALDTNLDGFAVIDIDTNGNKFELNNTDWILRTTKNTKAIFRMADGTYFDFSNSSILLSDGPKTDPTKNQAVTQDLGAIFFQDAFKGNNALFNVSNVILGGVGLWDMTDFNANKTQLLYRANPGASQVGSFYTASSGNSNTVGSVYNPNFGDHTLINLQNAQGCGQFVSHSVSMSNNRWTGCTAETFYVPVPEPDNFLILTGGLLGLWMMRRRRAA